jgi:hypothetical protein
VQAEATVAERRRDVLVAFGYRRCQHDTIRLAMAASGAPASGAEGT